MADSDDIVGELDVGQLGEASSPRSSGGDHLRAASGAVFVAVLPWIVAGYLLFSWAGRSISSVLSSYSLFIGAAAIALGAFSLWQVVIAARHLMAWAMKRRS